MYSKTQLITAIRKEIKILEHLHSKITHEHHDHQFTDKQRTVREVLAYLAASPWKQAELIFSGDMGLFANMKEYSENFQVADFVPVLHSNADRALSLIEQADEATLSETVTLFGFVTGTRAQLLVEMVYGQLLAYKMQLFLQIKHAGLHELKTANLWMGIDSPAA